ncbi:MAG: hypothetical protein IPK97_11185, partial [Ahniella sp.]|nr:hypothetical protein [Ahniella sp.]
TLALALVPIGRIRKAFCVSLAGGVLATPVAVAIGWGVVIAPIAWLAIGTPAQREIFLLQFQFAASATLHMISFVFTLSCAFLIGYYLVPCLPFNRFVAAPNNSSKPTPLRGAA